MRRAICIVVLVVMMMPVLGLADETIRIASFNLQDFGYGASRCKAGLLGDLAQFLAEYDVIAIQECMRISGSGKDCYGCSNDLCHLDMLLSRIEGLTDSDWQVIQFGRMERGTRYEYLLFLFNSDAIVLVNSPAGKMDALAGSGSGCSRTAVAFLTDSPIFATFAAGAFDFTLLHTHSSTSGTSAYNTDLQNAYSCLQASDETEQDVLLLGDFNTSGSVLPMSSAARYIRVPESGSVYDFIYFDPRFTGYEFTGESGAVQTTLSDHPLVWAEFNTSGSDDD